MGHHERRVHHNTPKPWKNANNPIAIKVHQEVVNYWMSTVIEFIRGQTTNYNEVFHSVKARFFNKNFNYGTSSLQGCVPVFVQYKF